MGEKTAHNENDFAKKRRSRLEKARLYVLLDLKLLESAPERVCAAVLRGGADIVQLRAPGWETRPLLRLSRRLLRLIRGRSEALFIVNNRADVALEAGADGVHLGRNDLPLPAARRILGPSCILGATTHNAAEARAAVRQGADYLSYGPVYTTLSKPHLRPRGLSYLAAMKRLKVPFFAIGGINPKRARTLRKKGIERVCAAGAVILDKDPEGAARKLRQAVTRSKREKP